LRRRLSASTRASSSPTSATTRAPSTGSSPTESSLAEPGLTPRPLKRQTLGTAVAERLRDMILMGELPPGRRTTQDELARALGVSTMPVREALLTLAAEGFVAFAPGRSFTIPATSREDV